MVPSYTPIKNIRVVMHVVQQDDGSRNFQNTPAHLSIINQLMVQTNSYFQTLTFLTNTSATCPSPFIADSRIRFVPTGQVYFHQDSDFWCAGTPAASACGLYDLYVKNNPNIPDDLRYNTFHMFLLGCKAPNNFQNSGYASGIPAIDEKYIVINSLYYHLFESPTPITSETAIGEWAKNVAHEFGHTLGLYHSFGSDYCCDTPQTSGSNNMMDYWPNASRALSQQQLSRMHFILEGNCLPNGRCSDIHRTISTDYCNKDDAYDIVIPPGPPVIWNVSKKLTTDIVVPTGAELIIRCKIGLPEGATIKVERGARLFIDGGTITHNRTFRDACSSGRWGGIRLAGNPGVMHQPGMANEANPIVPNGPGIVIIKEGTLEYAANAISTAVPEGASHWGGFVHAENAQFINNGRSAEFMAYPHLSYCAFINCSFINENGTAKMGVTDWACNNILFDGCTFDGLTDFGLRVYDAGVTVVRSSFKGMPHAIESVATAPLALGLQIGSPDVSYKNIFTNNRVGIFATNSNSTFIEGNDFFDNETSVAGNGESALWIRKNNFEASSIDIDLVQTGIGMKDISCNYYDSFIGIDITGSNEGVRINGEDFSNTYDIFISNEGSNPGNVGFAQGQIGNARWNYFSPLSGSPSTGLPRNINTTGATVGFTYYHPAPTINQRLKPRCGLNEGCAIPNNYFNQETFGGDDCDDTIQPPDDDCKDKPCFLALGNAIASLEGIVAPTQEQQVALQQLQLARAQALLYLVNEAASTANWAEADALLNAENTQLARRWKYGLHLRQGNLAAAQNELNGYPQLSSDDTYFVAVQSINLSRLSQPGQYALSTADDQTLHLIADSRQPSASYAKGLLSMLKGELFFPELPDVSEARPGGEGFEPAQEVATALQIYPNPAGEVVTIRAPRAEDGQAQEVVIFDALGRQVYIVEISGEHPISLNAASLGSGVFFAVLQRKGEQIGVQRFTIIR